MTEPNQRALVIGTALDETPDGHVEMSAEISIPAKQGGGEGGGAPKDRSYLVQSATGFNVDDATQNCQEKLSRKIYLGHRDAIFFGERMAKHGLKEWVDEPGRNPESNIRKKGFLVKGGDGKLFLEENPALEQFSTTTALRASRSIGIKDSTTNMRTFDNIALSDGIRPMMQVIDLPSGSASGASQNKESSGNGSTIQIHEIALFNKDIKLVGYLQDEEAQAALWVAGDLTKQVVTEFMPKGSGYVTLDLKHIKRHVKSVINGNRIKVYVRLTGSGIIRENNSSLDLFNRQNIRYVESEFDQKTQQQVQQVITKVQRQYGTDIFGFGEDIHRRHPYQWNKYKNDWDRQFTRVDVAVQANLSVRHIGNKGPSYTIPSRAT